jgi:hypothetical protein
MALVLVTKTRQRLAIGQSDPTLRPFQGLNAGFSPMAKMSALWGGFGHLTSTATFCRLENNFE